MSRLDNNRPMVLMIWSVAIILRVWAPNQDRWHCALSAGVAEWLSLQEAGQLGTPLRPEDAELLQLAPLRPYSSGVID